MFSTYNPELTGGSSTQRKTAYLVILSCFGRQVRLIKANLVKKRCRDCATAKKSAAQVNDRLHSKQSIGTDCANQTGTTCSLAQPCILS